jgi:hypothetical protein
MTITVNSDQSNALPITVTDYTY